MFCHKCGAKILDESRFCPQCGTPSQAVGGEGTPTSSETQVTSTQSDKKKQTGCAKGCLVVVAIFIVIGIIGGITNSCEAQKLEQSISNAQFSSTSDIQSFIREHDLDIQETATGWEAERELYQDCVDMLYILYQVLQEEERREQATADARQLLENPPEEDYGAHMTELQALRQYVEESELLTAIDSELERLEPLRIVEDVRRLLENPPDGNHGEYVASLQSYRDLVESEDLRSELDSRITEHQELADQEEALDRERTEQRRREAEYEEKGEEAKELTSTLFRTVNPQATINWATYEYGVVEGGTKVLVRFEYSVLNAFGTRVQRQYSVWLNYELTEVIDEQDEFLYFRE